MANTNKEAGLQDVVLHQDVILGPHQEAQGIYCCITCHRLMVNDLLGRMNLPVW